MLFNFEQVIVWSNDNLFRDAVVSYFDGKEIDLKPVLNSKEACSLASCGKKTFIFAGITQKECDFFNAISELKQLNPGNKVVVAAKASDVETAVKSLKSGADDFLIMPDSKKDIFEFCEKIIAQEIKEKTVSLGSASKNTEALGKKIIVRDKRMKQVIELANRVAQSRAPVFLAGESGTGKEVLARYIHEKSGRKGPFIGVNCAALPENLLESALFGHEKGAFTGAVARKPGKFEIANHGTILLDEITEMPVYLQAKLLRVLQEGEIDRLGGTETVKVDVRVIAATNRDPYESVQKGDFRNDLYHRINTIPVKIPPLRQRPEDIKDLSFYFIDKYNSIDGRSVKGLTESAMEKLLSLQYLGNVRELENIIRRALLICCSDRIEASDILTVEEFSCSEQGSCCSSLEHTESDKVFYPKPLREVEKEIIYKTLDETEGNRTQAAELLGISVRTLRNKLNSYKENLNN